MKVLYIDHMGSDLTVVNAARVSFDRASAELTDKDVKLIKYLAEHQHTSPFEHTSLTVLVECPLFIAAQWMRHRTMAFNQVSRRYTSENLECWTPDNFRRQAQTNRQGSAGPVDLMTQDSATKVMFNVYETALAAYDSLLAMGVCREQARAILPQGLMTKFYATASLYNWARFVKLRDHEGAQKEIQGLAQDVATILKEKFPTAAAALLA